MNLYVHGHACVHEDIRVRNEETPSRKNGGLYFIPRSSRNIYIYIYLLETPLTYFTRSSADLSRRRNNLEIVSVLLVIMSSLVRVRHSIRTLVSVISNGKETKRGSKLDKSKFQIETVNLIICDN